YDYHMATEIAADTSTPPKYNAATINPANIADSRRVEGTNVFGATPADNATIFDTEADLRNNADAIIAANTTSGVFTSGTYTIKSDYILYSVNGKYVNQQGVIYDPKVGLYTDNNGNYYEYTCTNKLNEDGTIEKTHSYTLMVYNDTDGKYEPTNPDTTYTYDNVTDTFQTQDARGNTIYADMTDGSLKYSDLDGFTIGADGVLTAQYASQMRSLARIELATFDNVEGLTEIGDTAFSQSAASGEANIKRPGDSGAGEIQSSKLEMSNVNLANEFSDMIVTQRGYQANARIITTSDSMLEELVNLKR
ncbi:MAG: flagellar hook-basal body complex protein, partial [Oscillospiraceae bacterium]|nr:flagellar hook-basal body complex protein [Oscillospiraceae bacterium]